MWVCYVVVPTLLEWKRLAHLKYFLVRDFFVEPRYHVIDRWIDGSIRFDHIK